MEWGEKSAESRNCRPSARNKPGFPALAREMLKARVWHCKPNDSSAGMKACLARPSFFLGGGDPFERGSAVVGAAGVRINKLVDYLATNIIKIVTEYRTQLNAV